MIYVLSNNPRMGVEFICSSLGVYGAHTLVDAWAWLDKGVGSTASIGAWSFGRWHLHFDSHADDHWWKKS